MKKFWALVLAGFLVVSGQGWTQEAVPAVTDKVVETVEETVEETTTTVTESVETETVLTEEQKKQVDPALVPPSEIVQEVADEFSDLSAMEEGGLEDEMGDIVPDNQDYQEKLGQY